MSKANLYVHIITLPPLSSTARRFDRYVRCEYIDRPELSNVKTIDSVTTKFPVEAIPGELIRITFGERYSATSDPAWTKPVQFRGGAETSINGVDGLVGRMDPIPVEDHDEAMELVNQYLRRLLKEESPDSEEAVAVTTASPTTEAPTATAEPTTVEPTTVEPTTQAPTTAELTTTTTTTTTTSTTPEPTTPEPTTPEPTTPEPTTPEPATPEPITADPVVETQTLPPPPPAPVVLTPPKAN